MRPLRILLVAVLLLVGAACDGSEISDKAALRLQQQVASLRDAAEDGDADAAFASLEEVRTTVREARAAGDISDARAARILREADDVSAELEELPDAPPPDDELEAFDGEDGSAEDAEAQLTDEGDSDDDD